MNPIKPIEPLSRVVALTMRPPHFFDLPLSCTVTLRILLVASKDRRHCYLE